MRKRKAAGLGAPGLLGAEFTKVYANTYGSRVEPKQYAVKLEINEIEVPKSVR